MQHALAAAWITQRWPQPFFNGEKIHQKTLPLIRSQCVRACDKGGRLPGVGKILPGLVKLRVDFMVIILSNDYGGPDS